MSFGFSLVRLSFLVRCSIFDPWRWWVPQTLGNSFSPHWTFYWRLFAVKFPRKNSPLTKISSHSVFVNTMSHVWLPISSHTWSDFKLLYFIIILILLLLFFPCQSCSTGYRWGLSMSPLQYSPSFAPLSLLLLSASVSFVPFTTGC